MTPDAQARGTENRGTGEPPSAPLSETIRQQAVLGLLIGLRRGISVLNPAGPQEVSADETAAWQLYGQGDYEGAFEVATGLKDYFDIRREGKAIKSPTQEQLSVMLGHAAGFNQAVETIEAEDRAGQELRGLDRVLRGVDAGTRLVGTVTTVAGAVEAVSSQYRLGVPLSAKRAMSKAVRASPSTAEQARATGNKLKAPSAPAPKQPLAAKPAPKVRAVTQKPGDFAAQTLDERIAMSEATLRDARQRTAADLMQRKAEGRDLRGGLRKLLDNARERLWILKRQKAYPDRQILERTEVRGVRGPDGKLTQTPSISTKGREPDFVEIKQTKATLGELKSEWELEGTLEGGPRTTTVAPKKPLAKQWAVEDDVLAYARKVKGKVVISGYDVKTGLRVEGEFDPSQVGRSLFSSTEGWGIASEWTH